MVCLVYRFYCYFYFSIYSVQFTDMYLFAEYEKSNRDSKFNLLIINVSLNAMETCRKFPQTLVLL